MTVESADDGDLRMDMGAVLGAIGRRLPRIILVSVLALVATYAVVSFMPRMYQSSASILVENRDNTYTRAVNDTTVGPSPSSAGTISSQIQLIESRDTLLPVIEQEKLASVPEFNGTGKSPLSGLFGFLQKKSKADVEDIVLQNLDQRMTVVRERDSSIITVLVKSENPNLAARLANAIAEAAVARRADLSLSDTADASKWLNTEIVTLRKNVNAAEDKVANFKVKNDLFTGTNDTSLIKQQLSDVSNQITAAKERESQAQSRAELIRSLLKAGQPIDGVSDVRNSVTIQQLTQTRATLASQRAQLLATLLPNHPSVRAVEAQIKEVDRQIGVEGRRVAGSLEAEAKVEADLASSLEAELSRIKQASATATKQGVTLDELQREATAERTLLESYLGRYRDATSRARANAVLPDIRILTYAAPSDKAVSPRTGFILLAVAVVALALQVGGILFAELVSGRALVDRRELDERRLKPKPATTTRRPKVASGNAKPVVAQQPTPPGPEARRERKGLRAWFSSHASTVGTALTSEEPPVIFPESVAAPAPVQTKANVAGPELAVASESGENKPRITNPLDLGNLSADLALGRARIVVLVGLGDDRGVDAMAERLVRDALHRELSIVKVNAGNGPVSHEVGISDLNAGTASFGDVVQKGGHEGLAEVPWGTLGALAPRSTRPLTLIEALSDIYEAVVILAGKAGAEGTLAAFAGLSCRVVLVSHGEPDLAEADKARAEVEALGFDTIQVIAAPERQTEVA